MKIVTNRCYGGYSLSAAAVKRLAELQGRSCYFFKQVGFDGPHIPITIEEAQKTIFCQAYDIPNPDELLPTLENWSTQPLEARRANNILWRSHRIDARPADRTDPLLLKVVEELGEEASGNCANLVVTEIPEGVDWEIHEHDGFESVREKSREW